MQLAGSRRRQPLKASTLPAALIANQLTNKSDLQWSSSLQHKGLHKHSSCYCDKRCPKVSPTWMTTRLPLVLLRRKASNRDKRLCSAEDIDVAPIFYRYSAIHGWERSIWLP